MPAYIPPAQPIRRHPSSIEECDYDSDDHGARVAKYALASVVVSGLATLLTGPTLFLALPGRRGSRSHSHPRGMDSGFARIPGAPKSGEVPVLRLSVSASGELQSNGHPVTLKAFEEQLVALKEWRGKVHYYEPTGSTPPQASEALNTILRMGVPFQFIKQVEAAKVANDSLGPSATT